MISLFKEFECSGSADGHYLENAITLPCNHSFCKSCLPKNRYFLCSICSTRIDINQATEFNPPIRQHLNKILPDIESKMEQKLGILKRNYYFYC